ncbi:putative lipoprotein [Leptospira weilii serovar Ranarum str. ICFT]|uniref:Lipoprotein n=1 Tax=Leptospira weilii serovar Ranarum str. ICFT TaxID=1218598 RepID=N1WLX4_9LEPT|nr:putative lipoprotein [Leptospira weilii serovar Ranarum str. ICFT]
MEGNKNRISVSVNSTSLNNQGTANVSVYSGAGCTGTSILNENGIVATTSKTFILADVGTYSVKASAGAKHRMFGSRNCTFRK